MPLGEDAARLLEPDESLYRRLIDLAPGAIVAIDEQGRIVLVNAQAEVLLGYGRSELIGQSIEVLVPERARAIHPLHRTTYFRNPVTRPMGFGLHLAARRSDGSEFPAEISLGAVQTSQGRIVSAAIRDVSDRLAAEREREQLVLQAERERAERQVLQAQRLESLGMLAGGVAHDFNNLLAVMSNYAAFASQEVERVLQSTGDARLRTPLNDINQIERAAAAAAALTRQLLTFARREVVRPRALSVAEVLSETAGMLQRTLGEDVELVVESAPDLHPVLADPGQLQQVLVNLAINARQAMPFGGVLTIATRNEDRPGLQQVSLRISDTGIGMDPATLARAFEPFFTTRSTDEGTGLGLSTVYGIVTQSNGTATLTSEPGVGTTFTAMFPAADPTVDEGDRADTVLATDTPATILVVDDEPGIRDVAMRILTANSHHVLTAGNAEEATQLTYDHDGPIHLLLTDVIMPQMNGPELAAVLRSIRPDMKVMYMSGYAGHELATRSSIGDAVGFVEKPFDAAQLLAAVSTALTSDGGDRRPRE